MLISVTHTVVIKSMTGVDEGGHAQVSDYDGDYVCNGGVAVSDYDGDYVWSDDTDELHCEEEQVRSFCSL